MGISTFIILKNEAETILSTLQCASLFSEEIIIGIDDATSDRSIDVIGGWLPSFGGEVEIFEFRWNDDFSEARNRAISKCTQDWIFQLDAHEHLRPGDEEKLVKLCEKLPPEIWLASFEMWDEWTDGVPNSRFYQDHLWRAGMGIEYSGAMHNFISREKCPAEHRVRVPGIVIYHKRTDENDASRKVQRLEMAKKVLLPQAERDPEDLRSVFYLAQSFLNSEILDEAEKYYLMYMERSAALGIPQPCEHAWACYKAGLIALARKEYNPALDRFFEGLKHRADSPEIFYALGEAFMLMDKMREAERFLVIAANTRPDEDHLFRYGVALGHGPWLRLMQLYYNEENFPAAFRAGMEGMKRAPESRQLLEGVRAALTAAAEKIETQNKKKKNLYVVDTDKKLCKAQFEEWENEYNFHVLDRVDYAYMKWADVVFIEGGTGNLAQAAQHKFGCRLIARLQRKDISHPHFKQINWENVETLIFPSESARTAALKTAGDIPCNTIVIKESSALMALNDLLFQEQLSV
jgi:tetratricopeptide (TPR) repeat protein